MGADGNAKQILCSKSAQLHHITAEDDEEKSRIEVNENLLKTEDSTLPIDKAIELVNKCDNFQSHEEELKAYKDIGSKTPILTSEIGTDPNYKFKIVWFNLIGFIILHIIGLTGGAAAVFGFCKVKTSLYCKTFFFIFN